MKKFIGIIIFTLIICIGISASAQSISQDMIVLNALNIGDFTDGDAYVTRGQFVSAVSDIMNYYQRPAPKDGVFEDVSKDSQYSGGIYFAHDIKIISGYGGTFGIDDIITYEEAIKILVSAMGYDYIASQKGGFPHGYIIIATQNDITEGISLNIGDELKASDVSALIVNAMNAPVLRQNGAGSNQSYEATQGRSFLYEYSKISLTNGVLTDDGLSSLWASSSVGEGKSTIDNITYNSNGIDTSKFLGCYVDAYIRYDSGKNDIIYISEGEMSNTFEIPVNRLLYDEEEFSLTNIIYENVYGKVSKAKISDTADYIYNGMAYADIHASDLNIKSGKLILIDNTGDNIYDVVHVDARRVFVVSGVSENSETIYTKEGLPVKLDTADKAVIYRNGVKADLKDVAAWDVASTAASIDGKIITVNVSSKRLRGKVEAIDKDIKTICVNGDYYSLYNASIINLIKLGREYEFCLDSSMNIVSIYDSALDTSLVGIVADAEIENGIDSSLKVQIYNAGGQFAVYDIGKYAKINEQTGLSQTDARDYILSNLKGNIAVYELDSNGKIKFICSPDGTIDALNGYGLVTDYNAAVELSYIKSAMNFDGKIVVDESTVFFGIPSDTTDLKSYSVFDSSELVNGRKYSIKAYHYGQYDGISDYAIVIPNDVFDAYNQPFVVEKISKVVNSEGEAVECVYGYTYSDKVKKYSESSNLFSDNNVKIGDVIRCRSNSKGQAIEIEKICDAGILNTSVTGAGSTYNASPRFLAMNVYNKFGNILECTTESLSGTIDEEDVKNNIEKHVIKTGKIYKLENGKTNTLKEVSVNDIMDYKSIGSEYSRVFIYSYSGVVRMVVVY